VRERPDLQRILIVAPATVVFKWKNEVLKWIGPNESVEVITTGKQPLGNSRFVIMSYSILVSQQQSLQALNWDVLILDEAHKVKSQKAQRSRCAKSLSYTHLLLISGTPLINRPEELYNLLNMLNPVEWGDWFGYCQRYCDATKTYWGWDMSGASNLDELKERLKPYMLRYTKQEVLPELPELTRTRLPVTVSKMEIRQALDSLRFWLKENGSEGSNRAEAMVRLGKLRQAVGMSKVPLVVEMVEDILEQDETRKVVIYAVHKIVIEKLVESLKKWGVSTITGEVGQEERQHRVNRFQNHPTPRIMIISSAGGEGIDLFKAGQIIFAEREWTPAAEEQAEARCHRIGQKNAVEAIYLIAQDTVDSDIDYLIQRKRDVFKNLLAMDEITTTKNTIDEFLALVKGG
jgi:SWI/SNF-related matrix-associated actin-dependent regulator 1 of chromatin subfamily A